MVHFNEYSTKLTLLTFNTNIHRVERHTRPDFALLG